MIKRKSFILVVVFSMVFFLGLPGIAQNGLNFKDRVYAQSAAPITIEATPAQKLDVSPATKTVPVSTVALKAEVSSSNLPQPEVKEVYKFGTTNDINIAINDSIVVKIDNFKGYYQKIICDGKNPCSTKLILNLDGRRVSSVLSQSIVFEKEQGIITFHLQRDKDNDEIWGDLIGNPKITSIFSGRETQLSVSLLAGEDATPIAISKSFRLVGIRWYHLLFWLVLLGLAWVYIIKRNISLFVCERSSEPSQKPFSLSRCQMLWWLFWMMFSYIFIYMATGATDTLNETALGLLGIGSGTTIGAVLLDNNSISDGKTQGFWKDLLSSKKQEGPNISRLQLILWTMVLTVIFGVSVYGRLAIPQLSPTLLALQAIASGTYLGSKVSENAKT